MVAFHALLPERLRKCSRDWRFRNSASASQRHGLDLVGRPHQLRKPRKSKTPSGKTPRRNREPGTSSSNCCHSRTQETACFDQLPGNEPGDAKREFPHSRDQRQGESRISGDAQKIANEKVTTFLHAQTSGNSEGGGANGQHHALQDQRVNECRVKTKRVKRDPDFTRSEDQRGRRPQATHSDCMPPGIEHANGTIERLSALHQRVPLRRIRQARYYASKKTEHSQPLHEVETQNTKNTD